MTTVFQRSPLIDDLLASLTKWLAKSKIGKTEAKRRKIAQDMFWAAYAHSIGSAEIDVLSELLSSQEFVFTEGDLGEHIHAYFETNQLNVANMGAFCSELADLTPIGLNTSPNACCGKNELLYRLFRPNSSQPTRGDILDRGEILELKGREVRIQDPRLSGVDYITRTNAIFGAAKFKGNSTTAIKWKLQEVFEIEKTKHRGHFQVQFDQDLLVSRALITQYFSIHEWHLSDVDLEAIFKDGRWNQLEMQQVILRNMFIAYKEEKGFARMVIFGDRTNVKIINGVEDLGKLEIYADYFRIAQKMSVGWYIR